MKTLKQIINQEPVFLNDWSSKEGVAGDFEEDISDCNVLFASYSHANYSGDAWVLLEKKGRLYEVNGGHCSCNGLEGQWALEVTTLRAIAYRFKEGKLGSDDYCDNLFTEELGLFLGIK